MQMWMCMCMCMQMQMQMQMQTQYADVDVGMCRKHAGTGFPSASWLSREAAQLSASWGRAGLWLAWPALASFHRAWFRQRRALAPREGATAHDGAVVRVIVGALQGG